MKITANRTQSRKRKQSQQFDNKLKEEKKQTKHSRPRQAFQRGFCAYIYTCACVCVCFSLPLFFSLCSPFFYASLSLVLTHTKEKKTNANETCMYE